MNGYAQLNELLSGGFAGGVSAGQVSAEELQNLVKALAVGSDRDPPASFAPGDGFAFRTEDLDPLMRVTTFDMKNIILWKMLQKSAAENTVVEWNETSSYGEDGFDGFMQDGTLPELMDSTVARRYAFVKFMGVQGAVTHGSTLVKAANGNLVAGETERKTMKLLELVERSLHYGDEALDAQQWSGYFAQMTKAITDGRAEANAVKDLRGQPMNVEDAEEGAALTADAPNYRTLTDLFCNPRVKSDMGAAVLPSLRGQIGANLGALGQSFERINTTIGDINVHSNPFINFGRKASATGLGDAARRPSTPILSVAVTTPGAAGSLFGASDAGDYSYSVVGRNRHGASVPLAIGASTSVTGDKYTFGIQAAPGNPTVYFEIYRSTKNGGTTSEQLIQRIPNPNQGFATQTVNDLNGDLPGTSTAWAIQWEPSVIGFKQLAPFMKVLLAQVDLNYRWAQVCYGVPVLYQPRAMYMIKNIGRAPRAS